MKRLLRDAARLAASGLPVLIRGETGSGKELIARALHRRSERRDGPFVAFDCAAVPHGLLEVELFGARAGAYTDQDRERPGVLISARGGTVLLEGVDALPIRDRVYLVLTSDHGMVETNASQTVALDSIADMTGVRVGFVGPVTSASIQQYLFGTFLMVDLGVRYGLITGPSQITFLAGVSINGP